MQGVKRSTRAQLFELVESRFLPPSTLFSPTARRRGVRVPQRPRLHHVVGVEDEMTPIKLEGRGPPHGGPEDHYQRLNLWACFHLPSR